MEGSHSQRATHIIRLNTWNCQNGYAQGINQRQYAGHFLPQLWWRFRPTGFVTGPFKMPGQYM